MVKRQADKLWNISNKLLAYLGGLAEEGETNEGQGSLPWQFLGLGRELSVQFFLNCVNTLSFLPCFVVSEGGCGTIPYNLCRLTISPQ